MVVFFAFGSALFAALFSVASKRCLTGSAWPPLHFTLSFSVVTGFISLAILPFVAGGSRGPWWGPAMTMVFLFGGHSLLALALSRGDASSVSPLMGLKVLFVPAVAALWTDETVPPMLWLAAILCVAAMYLLSANDADRGLPAPRLTAALLLMIVCTIFYAFADNWIRVSQRDWNPAEYFCVTQGAFGVLCGAVLLLMARGRGSGAGAPRLLLTAIPYGALLVTGAASWLSQFCIWVSFALADAVTLPNIVMSTRGLLTITLILLLGRFGYHGLVHESQSRRVYVLRIFGAALMSAAVAVALLQ